MNDLDRTLELAAIVGVLATLQLLGGDSGLKEQEGKE
jgi:hypothetical protein